MNSKPPFICDVKTQFGLCRDNQTSIAMSTTASESAANGTLPEQPQSQGATDNGRAQQPEGRDGVDSAPTSPPKPGIMAKLGLDLPTLKMMFK